MKKLITKKFITLNINDIVTLEELKKEFNHPNVIGSVFDTKDNICYDLKENVTSSKKILFKKSRKCIDCRYMAI